ncbi:DUF2750 domain-containing protein [Aeromonas cavernicola]|uniref:DUF2750 domain-containing protein n=1 Tax=Aeromonas cavernicola TaxID=1006623 RepID=A0A2H9U0U2_9GAMM|nr:DUF2750 domain-containing protein [Aeromonas cavernicola]PJG57631.1 DUF2750 domain-containing protein [Aeromonas cavernicola]
MKINQKQIEAVLALSSEERYKHFIKVIADWQEVWGLYHDGWALAETDTGEISFPMWPAKEYAAICAENEWGGYVPEAFSLDDLLGELLPNMKNDNVVPCIFYTTLDKGVVTTIEQLSYDLNEELKRY